MEGREHMVRSYTSILLLSLTVLQVRNEIAVLKRVSSGHPNVVTLHDYFEVRQARTYLTGAYNEFRPPTTSTFVSISVPVASSSIVYVPKATIMKRTSSKYPFCASLTPVISDAAALIRTIFKAVKYIHDSGIVHRGLLSTSLRYLWLIILSSRSQTRESTFPNRS